MKRLTKRSIAVLLAVIMCAVCLLPASAVAEGAGGVEIKINPYGKAEDSIDTVAWYKIGLEYYLFLPADCDRSALTVYLGGCDEIKVGLTVVKDGETTSAFSRGSIFTVNAGEKQYTVKLMQSENLPAVYIETESGSLDYLHASKENKEKANIRIYEDGEMTLDKELKQIKGRGNATWSCPKKPYNIKFDKKTSLLGMSAAKKWTLLASYYDPSLVRNPLAWYMSEVLGLKFGSEYRCVDLYINGDYMGNYIICESVEIGENRVDITNLTKATEDVNNDELDSYSRGGTGKDGSVQSGRVYPSAKWVNIPNDPTNIEGGYLLECDFWYRYDEEISGFVTKNGQPVVIKEPECASQAQVEYISAYWQEAEDAICSPDGYNSLGKHYREYFDMDSLAAMYLIFEISNNIDGGSTSTYFYKDKNGKLVASPVWDFDHAFGDPYQRLGVNIGDPSVWYANRLNYDCVNAAIIKPENPSVFNRLFRHKDFRTVVAEKWNALSEALCGDETLSFIESFSAETKASALMNGVRWGNFSTESGYNKEINKAVNFISERKVWLNKGFGDDAVQLFYDLNGGSGYILEAKIMAKGDNALVKGATYDGKTIQPPKSGLVFDGWNTEPDGSGDSYKTGDKITMTGDVTLYAQYKDKNSPEQPKANPFAWLWDNPMLDFFKTLWNNFKSLFPFC